MIRNINIAHRRSEVQTYRGWTFFIPGLTLFVFVLLVTLPWGLGSELTYVPPLLILATLFAWTIYRPTLLPAPLVFLVGIIVDVVTASPLGFWAFLFLCGYAVALNVARIDFRWRTTLVATAYIPTSTAIAILAYGLISAYFGHLADWHPLYASLTTTWFITPVLAILSRRLSQWMNKPMQPSGMTQGMS